MVFLYISLIIFMVRLLLSQDGPGKLFGMVMDMIQQFVRHIGKIVKDDELIPIVQQYFWRSHCKYCDTVTMICQYCNTVMRDPSTIQQLKASM